MKKINFHHLKFSKPSPGKDRNCIKKISSSRPNKDHCACIGPFDLGQYKPFSRCRCRCRGKSMGKCEYLEKFVHIHSLIIKHVK